MGSSASSGGFFGFLDALSRISNYDEIIGRVFLGALRLLNEKIRFFRLAARINFVKALQRGIRSGAEQPGSRRSPCDNMYLNLNRKKQT
jgi:hypothetical protein